MSNDQWWEPRIAPKLSQGDIVLELASGHLTFPETYLRKEVIKGNREAWIPSAYAASKNKDGVVHLLAKGRIRPTLIVSYDCDIDKQETQRTPRILVAPVLSANTLSPEFWEAVMTQRRRSLLPLPGIPQLEDCYADLRQITHVDKHGVDSAQRIASMSMAGLSRFRVQLIGFLTRINIASALTTTREDGEY